MITIMTMVRDAPVDAMTMIITITIMRMSILMAMNIITILMKGS